MSIMLILILFITLIFAFIGFTGNITGGDHINPFLQYLFLQLEVFLENPALFLVALGSVFFVVVYLDKTPVKHKNYGLLFVQTVFAILTGFFCSFVLLLIIAVIELNYIAVLLPSHASWLGITANIQTIEQRLQALPQPPHIIASDNNIYKEIAAIATATSGTDNFYGKTVLGDIPSFVIIPSQISPASMVLLDDTLIVTRLDRTTLEEISPTIGYLLVQRYFPLKKIKAFPKVTIMTTQEFALYRKKDAQDKLQTLALDISLLKEQVSSLSANIQHDDTTIATNQQLIKNTYAQKDAQLASCESQGTYKDNVFVRAYSDEYCKNQLAVFDTTVDKANKTIDSLSTQIQQAKQQRTLYQNYLAFFLTQQKSSTTLEQNIPYELGVFDPANSIKIVVENANSHEIADYFETLAHEYLHYASYQQNKHFASSFFEEGLTEYFARQTIHDELDTSTNLGYPVFVKIITQMMQIIPESEFTDIYFTKDETSLESTLNRVYGDNFYDSTYPLFQALQYTTSPQQTLQLANVIMKRIGGKPLQEKDLYSSASNL